MFKYISKLTIVLQICIVFVVTSSAFASTERSCKDLFYSDSVFASPLSQALSILGHNLKKQLQSSNFRQAPQEYPAFAETKAIVESHPHDALAHWQLGVDYSLFNEYDSALIEFETALKINGPSPFTVSAYLKCLMDLKRYQEVFINVHKFKEYINPDFYQSLTKFYDQIPLAERQILDTEDTLILWPRAQSLSALQLKKLLGKNLFIAAIDYTLENSKDIHSSLLDSMRFIALNKGKIQSALEINNLYANKFLSEVTPQSKFKTPNIAFFFTLSKDYSHSMATEEFLKELYTSLKLFGPDSKIITYIIAKVYNTWGKYDLAEATLAPLLVSDPNDIYYIHLMVDTLSKAKKSNEQLL